MVSTLERSLFTTSSAAHIYRLEGSVPLFDSNPNTNKARE